MCHMPHALLAGSVHDALLLWMLVLQLLPSLCQSFLWLHRASLGCMNVSSVVSPVVSLEMCSSMEDASFQ